MAATHWLTDFEKINLTFSKINCSGIFAVKKFKKSNVQQNGHHKMIKQLNKIARPIE